MKDIIAYLDNSSTFKKVVAVLPTGAGKSVLIAKIAEYVNGDVLSLSPSKELLNQAYEKYTVDLGYTAAIFSASLNKKEVGKVTFATPKSVASQINLFRNVKVIIIDEVHYQCRTGSLIDRFIRSLGKVKVIGLTATPFLLRNGSFGQELKMLNRTHDSMFNDIIHVTQISELIQGNFWTKIDYIIAKKVDFSPLQINSGGSDFTENSLNEFYFQNNLTEATIDIINQYSPTVGSFLIFVPSIAAAEQLSKLIPNSAVVHSKISAGIRDSTVKAFKRGVIKVMINVSVFEVGFDYPALAAVIDTNPTMSLAKYYQRVGRGVRKHESKSIFRYFDLAGNYDRFGKVENLQFFKHETLGWLTTCNDYIITGRPVNSIKVTINDQLNRISTPKTTSFEDKIWFGKYKGFDFDKLDLRYVNWLINESGFDFKGEKMANLHTKLTAILERNNVYKAKR